MRWATIFAMVTFFTTTSVCLVSHRRLSQTLAEERIATPWKVNICVSLIVALILTLFPTNAWQFTSANWPETNVPAPLPVC